MEYRLLLKALLALGLIESPAFAGNEPVITAKLSAPADCKAGPAQAWLSMDSILIYQVEVPPTGELEMHVKPGKYHLVITHPKGCFAEKPIEVKASQTLNLEIALNAAKEKKGMKK
ncbi:MAG: hypothetical protein JNL01_07325 [Bdellovibrionales bacterium]|nr:hypothetical protein [Bdellovibrionales bacterium]